MKFIVRSIVIDSLLLYILTQLYAGISIVGGIQNIVLCGLFLSILNVVIKPIFTLLSIPLSIITLGLYALVGAVVNNALVFFILSKIMNSFTVHSFTLPALRLLSLKTGAQTVSTVFAYLVCGVTYAVMKGVASWLI